MLWVFYVAAFLAGLFIGSFLNVVLYRGAAIWGFVDEASDNRGSLAAPRSYCPECKTQIAIVDLAPLVSYFRLGGKCAHCNAAISIRYPLVELLGAGAAISSVAAFGFTVPAALTAILLFALIVLAFIDLEAQHLPDAITLPLIVAGLLVNAAGLFVSLADATIGAAGGFTAFWLISTIYERLRGREGLGAGDAKLLAAIGAWGGWTILAPTVLVAALLTLSILAALTLFGRKIDKTAPIPFGPALCAAGAILFLATQRGVFIQMF